MLPTVFKLALGWISDCATTGGKAALKRKFHDDNIRAHGHARDEQTAEAAE